MKQLSLLTLVVLLFQMVLLNAQVAINENNNAPDASAILDVQSINKGVLIPRMSSAERIAINPSAESLLVYDNTTQSFWYYKNTAWQELDTDTILSETEVDMMVANNGYLTSEIDASTSNEIQTLSISGTDLTISGSNTLSLGALQRQLSDADNDTKIQVEESSDEDIIRFDVEGIEAMQVKKNANGDLTLTPNTSNVIFGLGAGGQNTGDSNIFIGKDAARINTSGRRNTVIGNQAGFGLADGTLNVYIGTIAGRDNASGNRNIAIGDSAGSGPSGNGNTYLGTATGALSGGNDNIFIGDSAGANNAAGNNNVMLGVGAGLSSSGTGNVFLGYFVGASEAGNNKLHIDNTNTASPLIYGEFDNNLVEINGTLTATGITYPNAGIRFPNAFAPDNAYVGNTGNYISFAHSGASEDFLGYINNNFYFRDSPGGGDATQPSVYAQAFPTYSSRRWKHNIQNLANVMEVIQQLRGVTYTWNKDQGGKDDFGFIAEEVHEILPQIAPKNTKGEIDGVEYGKITPYLVEAIKIQQTQIEQLQKENQQLQAQAAKIKQLETMLQNLSIQVKANVAASED